jgi:hypothetical protein
MASLEAGSVCTNGRSNQRIIAAQSDISALIYSEAKVGKRSFAQREERVRCVRPFARRACPSMRIPKHAGRPIPLRGTCATPLGRALRFAQASRSNTRHENVAFRHVAGNRAKSNRPRTKQDARVARQSRANREASFRAASP